MALLEEVRLMPLAGVPHTVTRAAAGSVTVVASGLSGLEAASYLGAIIGVGIAIATLYITISANNRQKRREYASEIDAAELRGEKRKDDELRPWVEFYREQARMNHAPVMLPSPVPPAVPLPPPPPPTPEPAGPEG